MPNPIRLILALHNHQPIGNFEHVFQQAYEDSYLPFLDVFSRYESLRIALHTSGSLMEWLDAAHPEYVDRLAELASKGRIEIIGGAYFEPILAMIPSRDRVGQIRSYSRWLQNRLGTTVRGTGSRTKVKVVKNKVAAPFREAEFDILYGEGISREGDLLDLASNNNILEKSGSWYSYKGERIGQGRENARQFLKDNKDVMAKLDTEVRKALGLIATPAQPAAAPTAGGEVDDYARGTSEGSDCRGQTIASSDSIT